MTKISQADWLAVEWHEDRLQVWAMQGGSALETAVLSGPFAEASNPVVHAEALDQALRQITAAWSLAPRLLAFVAGLPGTGWPELQGRKVPCAARAAETPKQATAHFDLHLIPGLQQAEPTGLTQGAETRIAGFLSLNDDWDGVICLPGATTVWAQISAGEVVSFQSFLTGALIEMLGVEAAEDTALDDTAFDDALSDGLSRPERLAARLASLKADRSLGALPAPTAQARLAGTLIGAELAAARPYWLGQTLAVIGPEAVATLYLRALAQQGAPATQADAPRMALAGITAVRRSVEGAG